MSERKKPEEILCPECNSKNWEINGTLYYLINTNLLALLVSIFPLLNEYLLRKPLHGEIDTSVVGLRLYECKNCAFVKFYSDDNNVVDDLNKGLEKIAKDHNIKLTKYSKNDNK